MLLMEPVEAGVKVFSFSAGACSSVNLAAREAAAGEIWVRLAQVFFDGRHSCGGVERVFAGVK